jgi:pyridoxine 4-dehydrogenase
MFVDKNPVKVLATKIAQADIVGVEAPTRARSRPEVPEDRNPFKVLATKIAQAEIVGVEAPTRVPSRPEVKQPEDDLPAEVPAFFSNALSDRTKIGTLDVPNLALGTINWNVKDEEDRRNFETLARTAEAQGMNLFDTAERYGASGSSLIPASLKAIGLPVKQADLGGDTETRLGEWLNDSSTVITKFAPTPFRGSAQDIVDACRGSASRLGRESVDLIQIHMPDIIQPFAAFGVENRREEEHWDGLAECYHSGLAKNVGVSNYGPTLLKRAHEYLAKRGVPLASNQIHFSLLYRQQGAERTVETCKELGVKCLAYYPLAMGLLTGKVTPERLQGKNDTRSRELLRYLVGGEGGGFPNTAGDIPEGGVTPLVNTLTEVAARIDRSPAQVALNWVICKGAIPIAGAKSVQQMRENVGALGWRLSEEDVAILDAAADALDFEFRGSGFQTADSKFVGYGFERWTLD